MNCDNNILSRQPGKTSRYKTCFILVTCGNSRALLFFFLAIVCIIEINKYSITTNRYQTEI